MKFLPLFRASFLAATVTAGAPALVLAQAPDTDMAQKVANLRQLFDEKSDKNHLRIGVLMEEDDYALARRQTRDPISFLDRIENIRTESLVEKGGSIINFVCRIAGQQPFTLRRDISFANLTTANRLEIQAVTDEASQEKRRQERAGGRQHVGTPAEYTFVILDNVFKQVTTENAAELQERLRYAAPVPVTGRLIDRAVTQYDLTCGSS
ncbi:MAG: hypothetical protein J0L77_07755 [Alphaproteobacteria bacterium]|nr:hypothetical protein [Alphaproteobacteria bacterium]